MTTRPLLLPNLGAEEARPPAGPAAAAAQSAARSWQLLFGSNARLLTWEGEDSEEQLARWAPSELLAETHSPAFAWLPDEPGLIPWLVTPEAEAVARRRGCSLHGAPAEVVACVHDKAFALREAERAGFTPAPLQSLARIFEATEMAEPEAAGAALAEAIACWPAWARDRSILKPRFGTSGRGRVAADRDRRFSRAALSRLTDRGGAILEAWLDRRADLSAHLWIPSDDAPLVLASTLRTIVSPAGIPLGHQGEIDGRGRVHAGGPFDEPLREMAAQLASAARSAGYHGPCGLDAFVFEHQQRDWLRVSELNARYTMGLVAAGIARRALPEIRDKLGLQADQRRYFLLLHRVPDANRVESHLDAADTLVMRLGSSTQEDDGSCAAILVVGSSPEALGPLHREILDLQR